MPIDAWPMDASGGAPGYSGQDLRLGTVVPFMAGAGASLGVRSGVRPSGSGTDLLVQAQVTPNMTVKVLPGVIVAQGSISATQGAYTWAVDTTTNLTISAAHATLDRTDLICVRIRDANVDTSGQRDGSVVVVTGTAGAGTPALPTDATYITIAKVSVAHASSSIVGGNIDTTRPFTAAAGAVLYCPDSTTEPAATSVAPGQITYRGDLKHHHGSNGAVYVPLQANYVSDVARTANVTATTTETLADSITVTVQAGRIYRYTWSGSGQSSAAGDNYEVRVRWAAGASVTSSGTQVHGASITGTAAGSNVPVSFARAISGLPVGQVTIGIFIIRTFGAGTITATASPTNPAYILIEDIGS